MKALMSLKAFNNTFEKIYMADSAAALVTTEQGVANNEVTIHPVFAQSMRVSSEVHFIGSVIARYAPAATTKIDICTTASDLVCRITVSKLACAILRRTQDYCCDAHAKPRWHETH